MILLLVKPKKMHILTVLRILDVYPGFDIFLFRLRVFSIPVPGFASKNLTILTQKKGYKALGNMIRVVHPGTRIQGSKKAQDPGSRIRDTAF